MSSLLNGLRWVVGAFTGTLNWNPTANRSIAIPDASGTILLDTTAAIAGAVVNPSGVSVIDFSIPAGVRRLTLLSAGLEVATSGSIVRLGTSGGVVSTGYKNSTIFAGATTGVFDQASLVGLDVPTVPSAALNNFCMTFYRISPNIWISIGQSFFSADYTCFNFGNIALAGELTTFRYISATTMNSGSLQILWEF